MRGEAARRRSAAQRGGVPAAKAAARRRRRGCSAKRVRAAVARCCLLFGHPFLHLCLAAWGRCGAAALAAGWFRALGGEGPALMSIQFVKAVNRLPSARRLPPGRETIIHPALHGKRKKVESSSRSFAAHSNGEVVYH